MIYVLLRPQNEAAISSSGEAWVTRLRGHVVDDDIYPFGGIVLKTIECSGSTTLRQNKTVVKDHTVQGKPIVGNEVSIVQRKVLDKRLGDDGKTTIFICEATQYDAQVLAESRPGWIVQLYQEEAHIPRKSMMEAPVAVSEEPMVISGAGHAVLLKDAKDIIAAGGPPVPITEMGEDDLRNYVTEYKAGYLEKVNDAGASANASN